MRFSLLHKVGKGEFEEVWEQYLSHLEKTCRPDYYLNNNVLDFIENPVEFYGEYTLNLREITDVYYVKLGLNLSTRTWACVTLLFNSDYEEVYQDNMTSFSVEAENLVKTLGEQMADVMSKNKHLLNHQIDEQGH